MLQEIVWNREGHDTIVYVSIIESFTNYTNGEVEQTWPSSQPKGIIIYWASQFDFELQFLKFSCSPTFRLLACHSGQSSQQPLLSYPPWFPLLLLVSIRSKYSLSCYFTTGSTFWWQVNFTKENQCATALKAGKEHKTGKDIFIGPESDHWLCLSLTH